MNTNSRKKVAGNPTRHREEADRANKNRKERVAKRAREEKILKAQMNRDHSEAIEINKVKDEEKKIWAQREKEEKEGAPKKNRKGTMKILADGIEFPSLNAALRGMEPIKWANESNYRKSCWTRINRNLKKFGSFSELEHNFSLI